MINPNLLFRLPAYWFFRAISKPVLLPFNYTFSITYRCNSKCKTCNIWKIQRKVPFNLELKTSEWFKIIQSLGRSPFWITISGGEPFLRKGLIEIIEAIARFNAPEIINVPTNGV